MIITNITHVTLSNRKLHGTYKGSECIHGANVIKQELPDKPTSKKITQLMIAHIKILKGANILAPSLPTKRPQNPQIKLLNRGKNIIDKYIIKN